MLRLTLHGECHIYSRIIILYNTQQCKMTISLSLSLWLCNSRDGVWRQLDHLERKKYWGGTQPLQEIGVKVLRKQKILRILQLPLARVIDSWWHYGRINLFFFFTFFAHCADKRRINSFTLRYILRDFISMTMHDTLRLPYYFLFLNRR